MPTHSRKSHNRKVKVKNGKSTKTKTIRIQETKIRRKK